MISFPNAKVNLGLHITQKRPDGYHNLESIFYPVPWCDALEIIIGEDQPFEITFSGLAISGSIENNLCYKAWKLISAHHKLPPLKVHLHKIIPMGAGLGGGSSDAAFMLKMINTLCELNLSDNYLLQYAEQLGSDCPFFIRNQPALATGKGEILNDVSVSLKGYQLLIIMPPLTVGTSEAYALITPQPPANKLNEIISMPVNEWQQQLINDFEKPVFALHPSIEKIKKQLTEAGAIYTAMSGSGAAVFGIFKTAPFVQFENVTMFTALLT